jgi:histidinol dehydrogenase
MQTYFLDQLDAATAHALLDRNALDAADLSAQVQEVITTVQQGGDAALRAYTAKFDGVADAPLCLDAHAIAQAAERLTPTEREALKTAYQNLEAFHRAQLPTPLRVETMPGVVCWQEARPIERVALYVPGGTAPLPSTLLHLGVPARVAGCERIVVLTPPQKDRLLHPAIAGALQLLQVDEVFLLGGAQAIAAVAYGTETVPRVDKVFGPGNRYVTTAKTLLAGRGTLAMDLPAGPSEVLVIADESANPAHVSIDLLAQAEHGADSQVVLCITSQEAAERVQQALEEQLATLPRAAYARKALEQSYILIAEDIRALVEFSNRYAPEHLILNCRNPEGLVPLIRNAGSVFMGPYTPESVGDYASGTNHTLPTSGLAKAYSGVNTLAYLKMVTFQQLDEQGLSNLGPAVMELARMETLDAHRLAVALRLAPQQVSNED